MDKRKKKQYHDFAIKYILDELTYEEADFLIRNIKSEEWDYFVEEVKRHSPKNCNIKERRNG